MLASATMVGFITTTDSARARRFYEGTLGLRFLREDKFALVVATETNKIRISPVAKVEPAPHTVLGWDVKGLPSVVAALAERGVAFERYPGLAQDERGVWLAPSGTMVAWFKDPDGNLLSIQEHP